MAAIAIRGLTKAFAGQAHGMAAVESLDLDVADNTFVTLLGPSGCGKTTTLRLIAGFLTPDAGTIHVGDRLVSSPGAVVGPDRRGMGMVFQNYAVWPHKTVFENVVFGLRVRRVSSSEAKRLVEKTLDLVNLSGFEGRIPSELSGGQQQRVALARSLVVEPGILLLDEPLSNLDAKLRERMRRELKQIQQRTGITFVYVTHDQAEAMALSDRIAVMHAGRLQQVGTPFEVYARPVNKVVADFMGLVNVLSGRIEADRDGKRAVVLDGGVRIGGVALAGGVPGERAELIVRPETIRIVPPGAADALAVAATVADQVYLGNICEVYVALASGQTLRVQANPSRRFAAGEAVGIALDASQFNIFREPKEGA